MTEYLAKLNQQYLAVGILVALIGGLVFTAVWPVWSANTSYQDRIDTVAAQLGRLRGNAVADEKLRPRLEQLRQSQLSDGHYLKSGTEAVAAAELQRMVKSIAGNNATALLSTQILPASAEEDFVRVALKVRIRGPLTGIVGSIHQIESYPTFLFLDNVSIRHSARRRTIMQGVSDQFDGEFDLIGYMPGQHPGQHPGQNNET